MIVTKLDKSYETAQNFQLNVLLWCNEAFAGSEIVISLRLHPKPI